MGVVRRPRRVKEEKQKRQLTTHLLTLLLKRIQISLHSILFSSDIFCSQRPLRLISITVVQQIQSPDLDVFGVVSGSVDIEICFKVTE